MGGRGNSRCPPHRSRFVCSPGGSVWWRSGAHAHAALLFSGSKLGKSESQRVLLREDDVQQLEFNSLGQVCRSKPRRLLLLNDQVRN